MHEMRSRLLGLCLPPLCLCLLDGGVTLLGQSPQYWAGNYELTNEASPTFHHLLRIHPAAFAAGLLAWCAVLTGIILLLPDMLALMTSIAATFGHTAGTATWLLWRFQFGYQAFNLLMLFSAGLLAIGIRYGWQARPPVSNRIDSRPGLRWGLIVVLSTIAVYLFLWPRSL